MHAYKKTSKPVVFYSDYGDVLKMKVLLRLEILEDIYLLFGLALLARQISRILHVRDSNFSRRLQKWQIFD